MRRMLGAVAIFLVSTGALAQGLSGLLRSVTGALQGPQQPVQQQGTTAVIGVRGMDQGDSVAAAPAANEDYALMEGWAATQPEAEAAARKKGLANRPVTLGRAEVADSAVR